MEKFEKIYQLMSGSLVLDLFDDPLKDVIENEFEQGSPCDAMYEAVYQAKCRLNQRLGTDEDRDVEIIINSMFDIVHHMSKKTYEYGSQNV